jgi:CRP/FNR family transcriptional regulator
MSQEIANKVNDFFTRYKLQYFKKGHVLIQAGHEPDGVYFIVGGQVRQYDISPSGDEVVVNMFKPPAFIPMSWAINHTPNSYFFEAFTNIVVRKAPAADVVQFLQDNPDVTFDLLSRVYKGLDGLLARMNRFMQNSARARLLFELAISAVRFGKPSEDGSYMLALHETELAARAGLTRETVNREIKKLKSEGLVDVTSHGVRVMELEAIKKEIALDM